MTANQGELAQIFRVARRTIQRWEDDGMPRLEGTDATYDLAECVAWALERERKRSGGGSSFAEARTRKTVAEAGLRQLELDQQLGRLVPEEDVLGRIREPLEAVDQQLRALPRQTSARCAARWGVSQGEAIALIGEWVEQARGKLRAALEKVARKHAADDAA